MGNGPGCASPCQDGPSPRVFLVNGLGYERARHWFQSYGRDRQKFGMELSRGQDFLVGLNKGGVPGIGKTQLGIQLAVNVQIPADYGGIGGKAVYIDTEGSFMVERASQIAEACIRETLDNFVFQHKDYQMCPEGMQTNTFLSNIFYFRICSYTEQIAVINYLDEFISEHKDVKIVIIDSITFHFRQDFDDMALRTRTLSGLALQLMKLAKNVFSNLYESSFQVTMDLFEVDIKLLLFA
ncbi:hypothetical protein QJS10_CPB20g01514 [Acorus calamus]|uniref:DNA repair protein RAD51 homolog 3 n=1 Tax=Acorus calamus TaxID=4465 RepID=A0AAV9CE82_ACOCL|nr:hypothetical protein QJS10_CPB20g01514 [Acorus calamus]